MARREQRRKDSYNYASDAERAKIREEMEALRARRAAAAEEAAAEAEAVAEPEAEPAAPASSGGLMNTIRNSVSLGGVARVVDYAVDTARAGRANIRANSAISDLFTDDQSDLSLATEYGGFGVTREQAEAARAADRAKLPGLAAKATAEADEANARLKAMEESVAGGRDNPALFAGRAVGSVASQPEMVLPLVGGAVGSLAGPGGTAAGAAIGALPMAELAREGALAEAVNMYREAGVELTEEDRGDIEAYANVMMGTEFALDTLGGATGGLVTAGARRLGLNQLTKGAAKEAIVGRIRSRGARVAIGAAAEGLTEGGTELLQEGVRNAGEDDFFSNPEVSQRFKEANAEMATDRLSRVLDAAAAGAVGGGAIGGIAGSLAYAAEEGNRHQMVTDSLMRNRDEAVANAPAPVLPTTAPVREIVPTDEAQMDLFGQPEPTEQLQAEEAARQAQLETEMAFRVMQSERGDGPGPDTAQAVARNRVDQARQEVEFFQDRIEAGDTSQGTLNNMTRATRDLMNAEDALRSEVENPRQDAGRERAAEPEMNPGVQGELAVTTDQTLGPVAARRKRLADQKAKEEANKSRTQRAAETKRRNAIMDRLIEENPKANDFEIERMADAEMRTPEVEVDPLIERAQGIIDKGQTSRKAADTRKVNDQLRAIQKRNPDMTAEQIAEVYRTQNPEATNAGSDTTAAVAVEQPVVPEAAPAPARTATVPDRNAGDAEIDALADQLGLSQRGNGTTPRTSGFEQKAKQIVSALVGANTQATTDVQNLLLQGKLIIAANQAEVGRPQNDSDAEYDLNTGQMYLYADRVDPNKVLSAVMQASLHESVHGGQFNAREGRGSVMDALMGPEANGRANTLIREAAAGGNRVAQRALARAQEQGANLENLELAPYFATEATAARGQGLGRLRGLYNDMRSAAREAVRNRLGVELDVDLSDLEAATQRAAGEMVQTTVDPTQGQDGSLSMISGRSNPAFAKAEAEGRVYRDKDGQYKFITSDADSRLLLTPDVAQRLINGEQLSVRDVVDNPTIAMGYPQLLDVPVVIDMEMGNGAAYVGPDAEGNTEMRLGGDLLSSVRQMRSGSNSEIHSVILHELQHGIQNVEGFAKGGSPAQFRTPQDNILIRDHRDNTLAHNLLMNMLYDDLDTLFDLPSVREDIRELHQEYKMMDIDGMEFATGVARALRRDKTPSREALNFRNELIQTMRDYDRTGQAMNEMRQRTHQQYLDLHGEAEARFVENNRTVPEDELPIRPPYGDTNVTMEVGGPSLSQRPDSLSQRAANERKLPGIPVQLQAMFDSAIGTGPVAREIMEYAISSPAKARMEAEQSMARYDGNLKDLAAERGVDVNELNKQITAELDAVDRQSNSYAENKAAFEAVARKYGRAGEDLIDLRDQIDNLTLDILRQRAANAQASPLTEAEKETYQTLRNNMGRYAHRTYAVNSGKQGKKYANKVWDDYESGDNVENKKIVQNALDYLVDRNLYIPDATEIGNSKIDTLRDLVTTWGLGRSDAMTRTEMEDVLLAARDDINGDSDRLTTKAEEIARELMGLEENITQPITSYYRGGRRNDGILKERENVPEPLRALMGEITHPAGRLMITAAKQAEFVARNRALMEMRAASETDPKLARHIQPPNATGTPAVEGMTQLRGDTWGVMDGYYVSPNMQAYLSDVTQQLATFEQATAMAAGNPGVLTDTMVREGLGMWGNLAGKSKASQIILNPMNFLFNLGGAGRMLLSNGNIRPATWGKSIMASIELISNARDPRSVGAEAKRLNAAGVTDSAFIGELKSVQFQRMGEIIREMAHDEPGAVGKAYAAIRKGGSTLSETYAMMDVWSKIANFYDQVETLTRYNEAAGLGWTPEQIDRRAADNVNRTNITYKRAAPLVKAIERSGITQFGTYFYEVFRAEVANVKQALMELDMAKQAPNAEAANIMRMAATKRMAGQLTSWGLTYMMAKGLSSMVFGEDEDEMKGLRSLLPDYLRDQDFLPVGKTEDGEQVLLNISRFDPMGPMTDIMRSMMHEDTDSETLGKKIVDLYIAPRIGKQIFEAGMAFAFNDRPSRTPLLQQVNKEAYSNYVLQPANATRILGDNQVRGLVNVMEAFAPGALTSLRETNVRPVPETPGAAVATAMSYAGLTMYKLDPNRATRNLGFEYDEGMKALRRDLKNTFVDNPETLSENQILSRLADLRTKEAAMHQDVRRVYRGMIALGASPREARQALRDNRIPADVVSALGKGTIPSTLVSKASIDSSAQQEGVGKTREEKREIKRKWADVWNMLNGANRELNRRQTEEN